ncbi:MAG: ribosomal RNA small subunit methyltransferase A [Planctomycetota bacterium]
MPIRALQQHDLKPAVAKRFVHEARIRAGDEILEIGPGRGRISDELLAAGARVVLVERDPARAEHLRGHLAEAIAAGRAQVLCGDALVLQPHLAADWRVVANPPFQITSQLLRTWLLEDLPAGPPRRIDLVLQKQAAQRLCGTTRYGQSRLSVLGRLFGSPRLLQHLKRDDVSPPSRVDLATFSLMRSREQAASAADLRLVDRLLEPAFAGPHSVRQALAGLASKAVLSRQAQLHGWNPDAHPRSVPPRAWLELARYLRQVGKV